MIVEVLDEESGAILFKKDKESLSLDETIRRIAELSKRLYDLEQRISDLENK